MKGQPRGYRFKFLHSQKNSVDVAAEIRRAKLEGRFEPVKTESVSLSAGGKIVFVRENENRECFQRDKVSSARHSFFDGDVSCLPSPPSQQEVLAKAGIFDLL